MRTFIQKWPERVYMIAKVRTESTVYDTLVFALFSNGWDSEIIGFDEGIQSLIFIRFWAEKGLNVADKRNVYIYDSSTIDETWITIEDNNGFRWLISDEGLLKCIRHGKPIHNDILEKCLSLQSLVKTQDSFEIGTAQDIKNLMTVAMGFHDSFVEAIHTLQSETIILMNTTWGCKIEFIICQVLYNSLEVGYGKWGEIFDASIFIENDIVFWVDAMGINSSSEIEEENKYFSGKGVRWKLLIT